jgi:hypothetical protein
LVPLAKEFRVTLQEIEGFSRLRRTQRRVAWKLRRKMLVLMEWANNFGPQNIERTRWEGFMAVNRWMKRRIERSRARCDRAENQKTNQLDQLKKKESASDQHRLEPIRSLNV